MTGLEDLPARARSGLRYVLGLPVELRRGDSALLDRATLGEVDDALRRLGPGRYVVRMTSLAGVHVSAEVVVNPDGRLDAADLVRRLVANPTLGKVFDSIASYAAGRVAELPPAIGAVAGIVAPTVVSGVLGGLRHWLGGDGDATVATVPKSVPQVAALGPRLATTKLPLKLRALDPASATSLPDDALRVQEADGGLSLRILAPGGRRRTLLQVLRPDARTLDVMMPGGATLALSSAPGTSGLSMTLETGVGIVDAMLGLSAAGRLDDAGTLLAALKPDVVAGWFQLTPGAAYAAAYGLLRARGRSAAVEVVEALRTLDRDGPDMGVLEAEVAAVDGRHGAALDGLAGAATRGLPVFGRGLSILVDRLRFYLQAAKTDGALRDAGARVATVEGLRDALAWAQGFAMFADFSTPVLCFTGSDPAKAGDEALDEPGFRAHAGPSFALAVAEDGAWDHREGSRSPGSAQAPATMSPTRSRTAGSPSTT